MKLVPNIMALCLCLGGIACQSNDEASRLKQENIRLKEELKRKVDAQRFKPENEEQIARPQVLFDPQKQSLFEKLRAPLEILFDRLFDQPKQLVVADDPLVVILHEDVEFGGLGKDQLFDQPKWLVVGDDDPTKFRGDDAPTKTAVVAIDRAGRLYFSKECISADVLCEKLKRLGPNLMVVLKADRAVGYERIAEIVELIRAAGHQVWITTRPRLFESLPSD